LLAEFLGEAETREQLAHALRERLLLPEMRAQLAPVLAGLALRPGAPGVELGALLGGQGEAEQIFLGVELERRGELRLFLPRSGRGAPVARGPGARQIGGNSEHALRAERLDPHLLERAEDRLSELALRGEALVQLGIVVAQAQRRAVRLAAQPRQILLAHRAARRWQLQGRARIRGPRALLSPPLRWTAGVARLAGPEADLERRLVRVRENARCERALLCFLLINSESVSQPVSPFT